MNVTHQVVGVIGGTNPPDVGTYVDASGWPSRFDMEQLGMIRKVSPSEVQAAASHEQAEDEEQVEKDATPVQVERATPKHPAARRRKPSGKKR